MGRWNMFDILKLGDILEQHVFIFDHPADASGWTCGFLILRTIPWRLNCTRWTYGDVNILIEVDECLIY